MTQNSKRFLPTVRFILVLLRAYLLVGVAASVVFVLIVAFVVHPLPVGTFCAGLVTGALVRRIAASATRNGYHWHLFQERPRAV